MYICRYSCLRNPRCGSAGSLSVCIRGFDSVRWPSVEVAPIHILPSMEESSPTSSPAQCLIKLIVVSLTDEESCFYVVIGCITLILGEVHFPLCLGIICVTSTVNNLSMSFVLNSFG